MFHFKGIIFESFVENCLHVKPVNLIKGRTEDEVWSVLQAKLAEANDLFEYQVMIEQDGYQVEIDIDIDPGGGFESGFETTSLKARMHDDSNFRFAIHSEHFLDSVGKFFGMEDVEIGYEEFDQQLIVKTNDHNRLKKIFSDSSARKFFGKLDDFTLGIVKHKTNEIEYPFLEFNIERAITDPIELRETYHAFFLILSAF